MRRVSITTRNAVARRSSAIGGVAAIAALLAAASALALRSEPREFRSTATATGSAAAPGPLALVRVTVGQVGRDVLFAARTARPWRPRELAADARRTICLLVSAAPGDPPVREICLRARRRTAKLSLAVAPLAANGHAGAATPIAADVRRSDLRSFAALFDPDAAGLRGRRFGWRAQSSWIGTGACAPGSPCVDSVPASAAEATLTPVHAVGCTRPAAMFVTHGRRRERAVALTFDDGPSAYTGSVLSVLEHAHADATFFVIGRQVAGGAALVRRELADGDVVGNHSWSHPNLAGGGSFAADQLRSTSEAVVRASGFDPCLFRAPYGAVSAALEREAEALGLTTIQWNVDPRDWSRPGTDAIVSRVVGAVSPGAIVIMHDGGGPRGETVAALPRIIATLRRRGYRLDTVPALLGQTVIYGR